MEPEHEHHHEHHHWKRLAAALRHAGVVADRGAEPPPPGFATRVLAAHRREMRADRQGLVAWRRWALAAAGASCAGYALVAVAVTRHDPAPQILPLPGLELPNLSPSPPP